MSAIHVPPGPEPTDRQAAADLASSYHQARAELASAERERDAALAAREELEARRIELEAEIEGLQASLSHRRIPQGSALCVRLLETRDMRSGNMVAVDPGRILVPPQTSFDRINGEVEGNAVAVSQLVYDTAIEDGSAVIQ